ncbi:uncharacterized protein ACBR49_007684 [Aulostomus maculatus]
MGRRQQRSPRLQCIFPSHHEERPLRVRSKFQHQAPAMSPQVQSGQEWLHKVREPKPPPTFSISRYSDHGTSDSMPCPPPLPAEGKMEPKVQQAAQHCVGHTVVSGNRHTADILQHPLSDTGQNSDTQTLSVCDDENSDTDLSDSERLSVLPSGGVPPQLELLPEVIKAEDCFSHSLRSKAQSHQFDFPDFLPPPFNSWSLSQLAVFYNMESRGALRPRLLGPLERYLERLLQLEWQQIQTVQEESLKSAVPDFLYSCGRSSTTASSRLSSPKCILQCQRSFPLSLLSSLASHSTLLSSCACTQCCIRTTTLLCCRSTHSQSRQSRLSPQLDYRSPVVLPRRSYSESRVHSSQRASASHTPSFSSHLQRMQALGNIRNPAQGSNGNSHSMARVCNVKAGRNKSGTCMDCRTVGFKRRSGSERRKSDVERKQDALVKQRSGSECTQGGVAWRRTAKLKEHVINPDAVAAIRDNLPGSKNTHMNRPKQVAFVS